MSRRVGWALVEKEKRCLQKIWTICNMNDDDDESKSSIKTTLRAPRISSANSFYDNDGCNPRKIDPGQSTTKHSDNNK